MEYGRPARDETGTRDRQNGQRQADQENGRPVCSPYQWNAAGEEGVLFRTFDPCGTIEFGCDRGINLRGTALRAL